MKLRSTYIMNKRLNDQLQIIVKICKEYKYKNKCRECPLSTPLGCQPYHRMPYADLPYMWEVE